VKLSSTCEQFVSRAVNEILMVVHRLSGETVNGKSLQGTFGQEIADRSPGDEIASRTFVKITSNMNSAEMLVHNFILPNGKIARIEVSITD